MTDAAKKPAPAKGALGKAWHVGKWVLGVGAPVLAFWTTGAYARRLGAPFWLAPIIALVVMPGAPLIWHFISERRRDKPDGAMTRRDRMFMRTAVATFVVVGLALGLFRDSAMKTIKQEGLWFLPRTTKAESARARIDRLVAWLPNDASSIIAFGNPGHADAAPLLRAASSILGPAPALAVAEDGHQQWYAMAVRRSGTKPALIVKRNSKIEALAESWDKEVVAGHTLRLSDDYLSYRVESDFFVIAPREWEEAVRSRLLDGPSIPSGLAPAWQRLRTGWTAAFVGTVAGTGEGTAGALDITIDLRLADKSLTLSAAASGPTESQSQVETMARSRLEDWSTALQLVADFEEPKVRGWNAALYKTTLKARLH